jgi:cell division septation protein DedD
MKISARHMIAAAAAGTILAASAPAMLQAAAGAPAGGVKAGVDAWQTGAFGRAIEIWRPLANQGDPDAQFNMGQAYKLGRGVPADLAIAQSWYQKAAQQGHPQAQANLGLILFQNGNRPGAMPWLRKAADAGDPRAQYVLGTAYFNGDLVGKDWVRAYAMMSRAASAGLPQAATNLAAMDNLIPLAQRQQGLALAQRSGASGPAATPQQPGKPQPRPANSSSGALEAAPIAVAVRTPPAAPSARPAAAGGWRVQLGAFSTTANAKKQWDAIRGRVSGLGALQPYFVGAGAVTRLQAGPVANRAAADRICVSAKAAGSACFPVAG